MDLVLEFYFANLVTLCLNNVLAYFKVLSVV